MFFAVFLTGGTQGERFTDRKKRWVVLSHQFLLYFEKPEPSSFPLGIFALDFCKVFAVLFEAFCLNNFCRGRWRK